MNKRFGICLLFIVSCSVYTQAQNLVVDGSFEQFDECPVTIVTESQKIYLTQWESPTLATPDYYNECNKNLVGIPKNIAGNAEAQNGRGYVGLALYVKPSPYYCEYIQTKLLTPLVKDSFYCLSFYYRLASYCQFGTDGLGMYVGKEKIMKKHDGELRFQAQLINTTPANEQDENRWVLLQGIYKATGGEQYVTIGYFRKEGNKGEIKLFLPDRKNDRLTAYYYIDNVNIVPLPSNLQILCTESTYQFK